MPAEPTAGDVMTEGVIAIEQDASVQEAAQKMREEQIRSLVVLDGGEAVGIVVGRDIVYDVVASGRGADTRVADIMTDSLVTAGTLDSIEEIARAMIDHDISRVPVLDGDELVGMVTQSNLMRAWPSYVDLLHEETQVFAGAGEESGLEGSAETGPEHYSGVCASCENYSDELVELDGERYCPECRGTGLT